MFKRQIGPTKYEQKAESKLLRTEAPTVSGETNQDYPKMEVDAGVDVTGTFTYSGQTIEAKFKATGKGKFGIRFVVRRKTTPEWWTDITYQREVRVMGEMLGWVSPDAWFGDTSDPLILIEGCIDCLEPDEIGPWNEVSRTKEYKKDRIEIEVVSTTLYDPPIVPLGPTVLSFSEGRFIPKVDLFDGQSIAVSLGSHQTSAVVRSHRVIVDGAAAAGPLDFGIAPLTAGMHTITIEATTDLGVMSFDVPIRIDPPLEVEILDAPQTMMFDARSRIRIEVVNNSPEMKTVTLQATASGLGWTLIPPLSPLLIPAGQRMEADIEVHAFPANDTSLSTTVTASALADGGLRADDSVDLAALFPISVIRDLEREILRLKRGSTSGGGTKNYYFS